MFIICKGATGVSLCRKSIESNLPLMETHQELVIFKTIISPTYTTKHKKCAYFIRWQEGYLFLLCLQSGLQKKEPNEVAVMHQNKTTAFLRPEQCM